jgi:hypothetical protein
MKALTPFLLGLGLAVPAAADPGLVIPLAANSQLGGKLLRTTLLVNNRGELPRSFSVSFLQANAPPGAALPVLGRTTLSPRSLAGCCLELRALVPAGTLGTLEVRGAPQVRASALLEVVDGGAVVGRLEIAAIRASDQLKGILPFNAHLDIDEDTAFAGFVRLGGDAAPTSCSTGLYRPEGGIVARGVPVPQGTLVLQNLADFRQSFSGELTGFGEFQCPQAAIFPFVLVVDGQSPAVSFVTPARGPAASPVLPP